MPQDPQQAAFDPASLVRPHQNLLIYYALTSFLLGPFFLFVLIPRYLRYRTLRYDFDRKGVSMRWGALFRREVHLNYDRIQDIHLHSNVLERWLGLGRVLVQTASGSSSAEMVIEGFQEVEAIRDFLYRRMRGTQEEEESRQAEFEGDAATAPSSELAEVLLAVAAELRAVRQSLEGQAPNLKADEGSEEDPT